MSRHPLGATSDQTETHFALYSRTATNVDLCLFSQDGETEIARHALREGTDHTWRISVADAPAGTRYGYRVSGPYDPGQGLWHDPAKLLVDPYATELDRPFVYHPQLSIHGTDTASLVPKAIVCRHVPVVGSSPHFEPGGLVYEINVRAFTMLHPDLPANERGTVRALTHPSVLNHLQTLGVSAIELMPVVAWVDERHLSPLKLKNSWGYNPIALMALDPRLCPGGMRELADTVATLHAHGIGVILDLVFNHTGESDQLGPQLSMRGIDNLTYYAHPGSRPGELVNDTGCGNTLACMRKPVHDLVIDSLRHFVSHAGIDGFRFDLATTLGRGAAGFSGNAALLRDIHDDPLLKDRVLIAEPWDVGHGGYQLGNFPPSFLEWNDRARDRMRIFWRGDRWRIGELATALAGSSDVFHTNQFTGTRTVNFVCAHDGFTLADLVSYEHKHNEANGEHNRDGHSENHSWNNGHEGETSDPEILARRRRDAEALLATLFMSRGTIMLMAGDEMGRSQKGNNNAYAQDNELSWIDWRGANLHLVEHVRHLSELRRRFSIFSGLQFLSEEDVTWCTPAGHPMAIHDWEDPENGYLAMILKSTDRRSGHDVELAVCFNRTHKEFHIHLPGGAHRWHALLGKGMCVEARSVSIYMAQI